MSLMKMVIQQIQGGKGQTMDNFKDYFLKEKKDDKKKLQSIHKKKHLLKHTVLIQAEEGDEIKGTKSRINIKSLQDCNIFGHATFNSYEDAVATFDRLTNLDEIVEYLQRNAQRYPTCADWAYIVRDEVDKRAELQVDMQPSGPEVEAENAEFEEEEVEEEAEDSDSE